MNKRKNKKRSKKQQNEKFKHQEHRNEKQGAVGSSSVPQINDIINEVNHYIPRSILDHNMNINNYKELEYKQNELMNKINNMRVENGKKLLLLENKKEYFKNYRFKNREKINEYQRHQYHPKKNKIKK